MYQWCLFWAFLEHVRQLITTVGNQLMQLAASVTLIALGTTLRQTKVALGRSPSATPRVQGSRAKGLFARADIQRERTRGLFTD
jgi:hypothetical protein